MLFSQTNPRGSIERAVVGRQPRLASAVSFLRNVWLSPPGTTKNAARSPRLYSLCKTQNSIILRSFRSAPNGHGYGMTKCTALARSDITISLMLTSRILATPRCPTYPFCRFPLLHCSTAPLLRCSAASLLRCPAAPLLRCPAALPRMSCTTTLSSSTRNNPDGRDPISFQETRDLSSSPKAQLPPAPQP